jgi:hypothetical protein
MIYAKEKKIFTVYQEDILTALIFLACLVLLIFFPTDGASQKITSGLVFLFIAPVLYLKLVLKRNLTDFGWQLGDWKKGLIFSAAYLVSALIISLVLFRYTTFLEEYKLPLATTDNFGYFIFYELAIVGIFVAFYEIFFRSFAMFYLSAKTGAYSILYQFFLFFLFFWITGNLDWNVIPLLIVSFFSGLTTFKSHSLLYSFVTSLFFLIVFDSLVIKFTH